MSNGKGSKMRPMFCSNDEYEKRWAEAFKKEDDKKGEGEIKIEVVAEVLRPVDNIVGDVIVTDLKVVASDFKVGE